jgi:glycosyltransferase involved in cell wall biosynthesis
MRDIRIFYKECMALNDEGFDVHHLVQYHTREQVEGITIHPLPQNRTRLFRLFVIPWLIFFKALRIRASVYQFHDPELIFVGVLLRIAGKKVIYDVHENFPLQVSSKQYLWKPIRMILSKIGKVYEDIGVYLFNAVITATDSIKNRFSENVQHKVEVVKNYVDYNEIQPAIYTSKPAEICYVGGISYHRGIDLILKSISKQHVKLNLAGIFHDDSYRNELMDYPGWRQTEYWGVLDRNGIQDIYDLSRVGMLLLRPREGFLDSLPIKLFEYMAAGIPIIASNFPLWKKIIEENQCGLCIDPFDEEGIQSSIHYLLHNEKAAEEMGRRGRELVMHKYNWNKEKEKLLKTYHQILYKRNYAKNI